MGAIIQGPDEGDALWYDGGLLTFKATGDQTGGDLLLFEARMPAGKMTPLHTHPEGAETIAILEGELDLHVDGEESRAAAGCVVVVPRDVPHAFAVVSEGGARLLVSLTPAGSIQERFFRLAGDPAPARALPPEADDQEHIARNMRAAEEAGLQLLGPPPFGGH
jgi:quercetin dioxygenase-like cupin family protein